MAKNTAVFLELTTSGVAEDANYTVVTSLSEYSTTAADHHHPSSSLIESLTIKVVDSSLFRPLELSSVVVATWMAKDAHVVFDVAVTDIPKVQMACVLSGLLVFAERTNGDRTRRTLTARKASSQSSVATAAALVPQSNKPIPLNNANSSNNNNNSNNQATILIDEDDLLGEEGDWAPDTTAVPRTKNATDDCGGRAPCDNCTCGRKDNGGNNNDALAAAAPPISSSNCGKCGMGDAFRCASCPFLGKPAFKPGQEQVVLEMQDDL
jgi:anamorsin